MIKPGDIFIEIIGKRKRQRKLRVSLSVEMRNDMRAFWGFNGPEIPINFLHPEGCENNKVVFLGFSKTKPKTTGVFISSKGSIEEIDLEFFVEEIVGEFVTKLEVEENEDVE